MDLKLNRSMANSQLKEEISDQELATLTDYISPSAINIIALKYIFG